MVLLTSSSQRPDDQVPQQISLTVPTVRTASVSSGRRRRRRSDRRPPLPSTSSFVLSLLVSVRRRPPWPGCRGRDPPCWPPQRLQWRLHWHVLHAHFRSKGYRTTMPSQGLGRGGKKTVGCRCAVVRRTIQQGDQVPRRDSAGAGGFIRGLDL